jgi:hypothetical protein
MPGWFAVVLAAYVVFYQTSLWTLAGLRITRIIMLSFGGVSSLAVGLLPFWAKQIPSPWFSERRLIPLMVGMTALAFLIAWIAVARQRCGGGCRRAWLKMLLHRIVDALPGRRKDFGSPAAAQFWFEWRRTGWLLPICIAFLLAIIAPASWIFRDDPRFTNYILGRLLVAPILLGFVIGKGFMKCEFWSANLSLPTFVAVKPLSSGEFVIAKMKVAAVSVLITGLLIFGFLALWLSLWADTEHLKRSLFQFVTFFPHSWQIILILFVVAFLVLTWRCLVSGMWVGLSGSGLYYVGSLCVQLILPALMLLAAAIWSDAIDAQLQTHPAQYKSMVLSLLGWILALGILLKVWFAVFSWSKITPRRTRQYLLIWVGVTVACVALAILSSPPFDFYRLTHLFVLGALLLFPLARLGFAPCSLSRNRHR